MKNFRPRSFTRWHAALIIVLSLAFLGLFSNSRSSAQQEPELHEDYTPTRMRSEAFNGPFDYEAFLARIANGEFPEQGGPVEGISPDNSLVNNNAGSTGTAFFTQSETTLVAFGNTVVVGFNDSGSNSGGSNKFTGFARSTDGGATFTDGGTLPTNPNGDAGDPVLARNNSTGRIYYATLQFSGSGIQVFRSDDNATTWQAPVQGAPGKSGFQDKEWITVDNFAGDGNGNVYLVARDFGVGNGIYFFRSTDNGNTFGPSGGTLITPGAQGAFVAVGPDHSVYAFWWAPGSLLMRTSTQSTGTSMSSTTTGHPLRISVIFSSCNLPTEAAPGEPPSESTTTRPRPTSGNRRWRSRRTAPILASSTTAVRKTRSTTICLSFMGAPPVSQVLR